MLTPTALQATSAGKANASSRESSAQRELTAAVAAKVLPARTVNVPAKATSTASITANARTRNANPDQDQLVKAPTNA